MTREEVQKLAHGLYVLLWKEGEFSLASVGSLYNGDRWFAPTNWVGEGGMKVAHGEAWEDVKKVQLFIRKEDVIEQFLEKGI